MALWLEYRTRDDPVSNSLVAILKLRQFRKLHIATVHLAVQMRTWLLTMADMLTNSIRAVIAAWLKASHISRLGVRMNMSARCEV